jgi:hypothetical protein
MPETRPGQMGGGCPGYIPHSAETGDIEYDGTSDLWPMKEVARTGPQ